MNQSNHNFRSIYLACSLSLLLTTTPVRGEGNSSERKEIGRKTSDPNIVFILSDDMGYGDMNTYNPDSQINTPNIDMMAKEGMKFTDAHAAAAWCTPSRFGLLTGRYPMNRSMAWRKRSLIPPNLTTIAAVLRKRGYRTACIGKWHLGFNNVHDWRGFDFSKAIEGGPLDKGFGYFFGIHASLDIPPYFFIYGRHAVEAPTSWTRGHRGSFPPPQRKITSGGEAFHTPKPPSIQGQFWRKGRIAPHFDFTQVTPELTDSVLAVVERDAKAKDHRPFFMYYAMTGPHTPWVPTKQFKGKSEVGQYGDFVQEIDFEVGRIMRRLKDLHIAKNTILVFASDNGPVWFKRDVEYYHHSATYIYRGMKIDFWEGGHREPLIFDWPGKIKAGSVNHHLVSFTDMLATFAHIAGAKLGPGVGRDSYNITPLLLGTGLSGRNVMVEQNNSVREGYWKLIYGSGMGGLHARYGDQDNAKFEHIKFELYNLANDPSEKYSVYNEHPKIVDSLKALMKRLRKREFEKY